MAECPKFSGILRERTEQEIEWRRKHDLGYQLEEAKLEIEDLRARAEAAAAEVALLTEALEATQAYHDCPRDGSLAVRNLSAVLRKGMDDALAALAAHEKLKEEESA